MPCIQPRIGVIHIMLVGFGKIKDWNVIAMIPKSKQWLLWKPVTVAGWCILQVSWEWRRHWLDPAGAQALHFVAFGSSCIPTQSSKIPISQILFPAQVGSLWLVFMGCSVLCSRGNLPWLMLISACVFVCIVLHQPRCLGGWHQDWKLPAAVPNCWVVAWPLQPKDSRFKWFHLQNFTWTVSLRDVGCIVDSLVSKVVFLSIPGLNLR